MSIDEVMRSAGEKGMARELRHRPSAEDYIRGYFNTDDPSYGLRMLISQFEHQKQRLPFHVGDRVRVRKRYWHLGDSNDGWQGYSPMFADATGTITAVDWSVLLEHWYLLVQYKHPYRFSDYMYDFNVKDHPSSFMFNLNHVKKV